MEITLKNECCLYAIIPISFLSITICNLLIDFPSYIEMHGQQNIKKNNCILLFGTVFSPCYPPADVFTTTAMLLCYFVFTILYLRVVNLLPIYSLVEAAWCKTGFVSSVQLPLAVGH